MIIGVFMCILLHLLQYCVQIYEKMKNTQDIYNSDGIFTCNPMIESIFARKLVESIDFAEFLMTSREF